MSTELSMVDSKISEIITIIMLQPEFKAPDNYRDLAEYLVRFNLQKAPDPLESIRSMVATFESNRGSEEEEAYNIEFGSESQFLPEQDEAYRELETQGMLDEMEWRKNQGVEGNLAFDKIQEECLGSTLTPVEHNVVLGLILQQKKAIGEYNLEFFTTIQDLLVLAGFSTLQIMEVMSEYLNPEHQRFNSADVQYVLQQDFCNAHEYN